MNKYALDCEMVASGNSSMLARVSIVDVSKQVVLDTYVKPTSPVTDYRTPFSGITAGNLVNAPSFNTVQDKVISILTGSILIGHSLKFDLEALHLTVPQKNIRDLAEYKPFQSMGQAVSLKELARKHLGKHIQMGVHDSVEDAKAAMDLYLIFGNSWERSLQ